MLTLKETLEILSDDRKYTDRLIEEMKEKSASGSNPGKPVYSPSMDRPYRTGSEAD